MYTDFTIKIVSFQFVVILSNIQGPQSLAECCKMPFFLIVIHRDWLVENTTPLCMNV